MRILKGFCGVRIPSSPPNIKNRKSRIVAANGLTMRDFLVLPVPNYVSMSRKNMNICCFLDCYATRNATRILLNNGHLFTNFLGIFFHRRRENVLIYSFYHIGRAVPHKFGNVFLWNVQQKQFAGIAMSECVKI